MNRYDIINTLVTRIGGRSYLEIGVAEGNCLAAVQAEEKLGVDPDPSSPAQVHMTSDAFFASKAKGRKWDVIFIDGLHTQRQAYTDFCNARRHLNQGGYIVMHDVLPANAEQARHLADYDGIGVWCGDVWAAWARLRVEHSDLDMRVVDTDCGVGVVREGSQERWRKSTSWKTYLNNRNRMMRVVSVAEFMGGG